jgi:hypothetical protein
VTLRLDDLPMRSDPTPPAAPPPRSASPGRWIVLAAVIIAAGALVYLFWMTRTRPEPIAPAPASASPVAQAAHRPAREPLDLPPLNQSDAFVRDLVAALAKHPLFAKLLATKDLIRSATLAVDETANGKTPAVPLGPLRPATHLDIVGGARGPIDPRTYHRWDAATEALTSVRVADAAKLYVNLKPLFDAAYEELGHPNADFDDAILRAARFVDDVPDLAADPVLTRGRGYFDHTDPALEGLAPVQKQMLLLGPDNERRLKTWIRSFAEALDLKL